MDVIKIGILVTSDRGFSGEYEDLSGKAIKEVLISYMKNEIIFDYAIIKDSRLLIEELLKRMSLKNDLIITTGGSGPAKRDVTVEATESICKKILHGFGEQMRLTSLQYVKTAILSRQTAGILNNCLIINLPGKPKSIKECLDSVFSAVPYCIDLIGGRYIVTEENVIKAYRPK